MTWLTDTWQLIMSRPALGAAIAGVLSTIITACVAQAVWPSHIKRGFSLGVSVVLTAVGVVWFVPGWPYWGLIGQWLAITVGVSQILYTVLKPIGVIGWLEHVTETRTAREARMLGGPDPVWRPSREYIDK